MQRRLGGDTIIVRRLPLKRDPVDNTQYYDHENPELITIEGCNIQPTKLSDKLRYEVDLERQFQQTFFRVYAPAPEAEVIKYTDEVEFKGDIYQVQGAVTEWRRRDGTPHHFTFMMKLREG